MSTHNIQFHDTLRKFPEIHVFVFLSYRKIFFVGTQKRVRISHGKRAIGFELLRFDCNKMHAFIYLFIILYTNAHTSFILDLHTQDELEF